MTKRFLPVVLAGTAALSLGGCLSFGAKPPESLLALTPAQSLPVGEARTAAANSISVGIPSVSQEASTQRVPVRATDTTVAYIKDAQWVEPPNRLFTRLLVDVVGARTGRLVVGPRGYRPGANRLDGDLKMFGVDAGTREAVVTFDATFAEPGATPDAEGRFRKRRFEARVPVSAIEPQPVGVALNQAANQVATEVADWIGA